jgi:hypothetical protein
LHEPETSLPADRDIPDTEVIALSAPTPVFVDSTGRRRKVLRRLAYVFGGLCLIYGGLISVSLAGGPVSSSAILPLPDLPIGAGKPAAKARLRPAPTTAAPPTQFAAAPLVRHPVDFSRTAGARRTPTVIPPPTSAIGKPGGRSSSGTSHALESATTATTTTPGSSSPTTPATSPSSPAPAGGTRTSAGPSPSPSKTRGDRGGTGGGTGTPTAGTTTGGSGVTETTADGTAPTTGSTPGTKVDAMARGNSRRPDATEADAVGRQLGAEIGNDLAGTIGTEIGAILDSGEPA